METACNGPQMAHRRQLPADAGHTRARGASGDPPESNTQEPHYWATLHRLPNVAYNTTRHLQPPRAPKPPPRLKVGGQAAGRAEVLEGRDDVAGVMAEAERPIEALLHAHAVALVARDHVGREAHGVHAGHAHGRQLRQVVEPLAEPHHVLRQVAQVFPVHELAHRRPHRRHLGNLRPRGRRGHRRRRRRRLARHGLVWHDPLERHARTARRPRHRHHRDCRRAPLAHAAPPAARGRAGARGERESGRHTCRDAGGRGSEKERVRECV
ncbi:unnamed protein product [Chondrus crispus]|uniref:Uncharacterized protein n=1 Tax=Chondrus crispus TaxID=2769 RepID=R7QHY6_CHOCR|nr:unnamed protein product [Chondrus crispus]CDF37010.1 unnamed protein product [Chondrus crispus]|eukprot:XP_005716829.1 unnamed protein product [Chondrus crispus]